MLTNSVSPDKSWTRGDPVSRALLDLAAGQDPPADLHISSGLIELAQRHGLIGMLATHTHDDFVRAVWARELARKTVMEQHLVRLLSELHEAGVRVALLKGPGIAESYRAPQLRSFSDLDLLVPPSQLDDALRIVGGDEAAVEVPAKRPRADKRDIVFQDRSGVKFNVDLHWDLFLYSQLRGRAKGATDAAWKEANQRPDSPWGPLWEIPAPYMTAFLSAHAVLDHRFRLILFRDFLELNLRGVDYDALERVATDWGLRSTTYLALWMSRAAFGVQVPQDFLASIRPTSVALTFLEIALPRTDLARFDGHRPHPANLATVLLNDSQSESFLLLLRAPGAFPRWRRRVESDHESGAPPRTLIVVSTDLRRGAEVFSERLRDGLNARGWVVETVGLRGSGREPRADVQTLVEHSGRHPRRFDPQIVRALRSKIQSFQPEVVVANGGATLRYGLVAKVGLNCNLTYIGIGEPNYWIRSRLSRWFNRLMLRRTDQVLAVSKATRDQLVELEPTIADRTHVTYTGVPSGLFDVRSPEIGGPLRVLMVGSLTTEKDPALAQLAVAQVDNAVLRYVGVGPLEQELREAATTLGISERVEFVGSVSDVAPHLEWADVLILTSRSEGLPGAILEASAAEVPTVAVDVGGVGEAVLDGVGGYVTKRSASELAAALTNLDSDRQRLTKMGEAARHYVFSKFLLDDVIDRYADLLISLKR